MAARDQMAIAQEAREKELLERLASMEAKLDVIMSHLGLTDRVDATVVSDEAAEKLSILSGGSAKTETPAGDEEAAEAKKKK